MRVRAKFLVKSLSFNHHSSGDGGDVDMYDVVLEAVNNCSLPQPDPEDEDSVFGHYTPSGQVTMMIRGDAARFFQPGECVYADFQHVAPKE